MCYKYINKYDTVFIWCEVANTARGSASYLRCFADLIEDYASHYNYCPYCGRKLEDKNRQCLEE